MTERAAWSAALAMMNEIHQRMGLTWVYQMRLERLAVDNIAIKHIKAAYEAGMAAAREQKHD